MALPKFIAARTEEVQAKRERRKEARPGELLDAALDLFVEKGFAATRAEEVAARAGVSKGTLFLYFPSKEELFKAVVRENISGRFAEWNDEFQAFDGSTADMVRYCMRVWWDRLGATRASGITKLIIGEARNFPDITAFYQQEVIKPAQDLIRRILQRGVDRGEFRIADMDYALFSITAPMVFLVMMKHSLGACMPQDYPLDPERYLASQVDTLLHGLLVRGDEKNDKNDKNDKNEPGEGRKKK
ncbi:TetR/AcrR family transcriptional regulator [Caenimonas aquaedulcis]|uniref:TetR/AcrR family transcriptional regulator n=1 Tax=Caenimonas aquaedulcis TaxID=2793270 RepID=A0A931H7J3_9BURK|nr:TetR/AcrR family transcriptional regulator [Caenimonas aquaedulcis]MBG9390134.1 TetR/AcrR family transcriptional regulator [Caenimonas aquaedulcis]